jgi:hypothetical protein
MKIAVCSDVHLEFGPLVLENPGDVEVLVLSGDICVAADLRTPDPYSIVDSARTDRFHEFMGSCSRNFPHVVYVMGNHEHYHGDFALTSSTIRNHLKEYENIHLLDKEVFDIGDYRFIGGTLWTDMNKEDSLTLYHIKSMMNDFRTVKNSNRVVHFKDQDGKHHTRVSTFCPEDAVEDHKKMLEYIKTVYADTPPWKTVVVCGHHAPSRLSTHPRYKNEELMNGGYSSDLHEFILDRPGIKMWTHGHTHEDFDYMIGDCRIVCNPRGYINYEERAGLFKLKAFEV